MAMKPWKSLIIFGIVLVALIGVLVAVRLLAPTTVEPMATPTPGPDPLYQTTAADVYTVTVENALGTVSYQANESTSSTGTKSTTWSVADPAGTYYDASLVSSAAGSLLYYYTMTEVSAEASDLAAFGLDTPAVKITLRLKDGTRHVVKIGDAAPQNAGYYATLDDARRVVVVSSSTFTYTQKGVLDLLDKTLPLNGLTAENVLSLELVRSKDDLDVLFSLEGTGDAKTWKVKSPVAADADPTRFTPLITALAGITASSYVELNPSDLAKYGLDEPLYTFVLKSTAGDVTISVGGDAGNGANYFMSSAIPAVFTYNVTNLTNVDTPLVNMISKLIYLPNIWSVSRIDIDIDGQHIVATIDTTQDDKDDGGMFLVNGKNAKIVDGEDKSYFRAFYVSILSILVDRIDATATPVDEADVKIVYTAKEGGATTTLTFTKTDRDGYYVFRNGVYTGFINNASDFYGTDPGDLGLLPTYDVLIDAMKNAVDGIYATPTPAPTTGG